MKRIRIVANGKLWKGIVNQIRSDDFVIGVDRAAFWLLAQGIVPNVAIGDFDSCTAAELKKIKKNIPNIQTFSSEKDFTDTELALSEAIRKNPSEIIIFGGLGSRFDHTLGAVFLLEKCLTAQIPASLEDEGNSVTLQGRGRTILEKREGKRYLSVIPVTNTIQISLSGFKYDLSKALIRRGQTIGISNEFIDKKAIITVHHGKALIIQSRD